ncbi:hypothetical protein TNCV_2391661 [Trichonephila clavipes]|nr:hypothetical protein TNCV_2391661 [Trichonephila clavipes]
MKEGLIALNYECSKCNERMGLYERKSAVLDGDFEWVCSTITSQNIYGSTPMILLTMRPSRLFVKIRCHAVASTRKRSAVRKCSIEKNFIWKETKEEKISKKHVSEEICVRKRRSVLAMRYIGQGMSSLETFCSLVCLPNPESQKAYDRINAKIAEISEALANASMKKAAAEEKNY